MEMAVDPFQLSAFDFLPPLSLRRITCKTAEILLPHFHLLYSANLETLVDMAGLCETLRKAAARIEIFPLAGIRVRAKKSGSLCDCGWR